LNDAAFSRTACAVNENNMRPFLSLQYENGKNEKNKAIHAVIIVKSILKRPEVLLYVLKGYNISMPELPEVQTVTNYLKELEGLEIKAIAINWKKSFVGDTRFSNASIHEISRRGKYIKITLSKKDYLYIHLRMSGRLSIEDEKRIYNKHEHVIMELSQGKFLVFHDTRKFGRIMRVSNPAQIEDKLGVEPFQMDINETASILIAKKRGLKSLLLDQSFIAGLGNIYVDEALFEAKIHPLTKGSELTLEKAKQLLKACQIVLKRGLENKGTSLGKGKANYKTPKGNKGENQHALRVFRRTGQPCPICHNLIKRIVVSQRSTHFCPYCQLGT